MFLSSIYLYLCAFFFFPPVSFSILALWFSLMADEGLALLLLKKEQRAVWFIGTRCIIHHTALHKATVEQCGVLYWTALQDGLILEEMSGNINLCDAIVWIESVCLNLVIVILGELKFKWIKFRGLCYCLQVLHSRIAATVIMQWLKVGPATQVVTSLYVII